MANIKDVAKRAGVSVTTVSRVINNIDPVNPETRLAVEQAMAELDYVPNQLARGMRTKRTNTIGVVIPEFINSFYHELFQYIEEQAALMGYSAFVCTTREHIDQGIDQIRELISRRIDGIILCTYRGHERMMSYLEQVARDIPVIFLDNLGRNYKVNTIYTDGFKAMEKMVLHLRDLGHTNIAFIKGLEQYPVANDRFAGFKHGIEKSGLRVDKRYIFEGDYSLQSGYRAAQYFMEECSKGQPDAIMAASDLMAIGAMNYLLSKGIRIPQDIAVTGFDDISLAKLMVPPLTTIAQPIKEIAKQAMDLIINSKDDKTKEKKNLVLEGELKIRHSTDPTKPRVVDLNKNKGKERGASEDIRSNGL